MLLTSARLSRVGLGLWLLLCRRRLLLLAAGLRGLLLLLEQCAGRWRLASFQTTTGSVYHFLGYGFQCRHRVRVCDMQVGNGILTEYCWTVQQLLLLLLLLLWRGH